MIRDLGSFPVIGESVYGPVIPFSPACPYIGAGQRNAVITGKQVHMLNGHGNAAAFVNHASFTVQPDRGVSVFKRRYLVINHRDDFSSGRINEAIFPILPDICQPISELAGIFILYVRDRVSVEISVSIQSVPLQYHQSA